MREGIQYRQDFEIKRFPRIFRPSIYGLVCIAPIILIITGVLNAVYGIWSDEWVGWEVVIVIAPFFLNMVYTMTIDFSENMIPEEAYIEPTKFLFEGVKLNGSLSVEVDDIRHVSISRVSLRLHKLRRDGVHKCGFHLKGGWSPWAGSILVSEKITRAIMATGVKCKLTRTARTFLKV